MTPKEQADRLYRRYFKKVPLLKEGAKKSLAVEFCLIAVDEIIEAINWHPFEYPNESETFWNDVKKELEAL